MDPEEDHGRLMEVWHCVAYRISLDSEEVMWRWDPWEMGVNDILGTDSFMSRLSYSSNNHL